MYSNKITLTHLRGSTILPELAVMLGLILALTWSQVEVTSPGGNVELLPPLKEALTQLWYGSYINIDPPAPTPSDIIQITVGGEWPNGCVPTYQSHQLVGHVIRIDATAGG